MNNTSIINKDNLEYKNLKRTYLYKEIFEKDYNHKEFIKFLNKEKKNGNNINNWELYELINKVKEFKSSDIEKKVFFSNSINSEKQITMSKLSLNKNIYIKIKELRPENNEKIFKINLIPINVEIIKTCKEIMILKKLLKSNIPLIHIPNIQKKFMNSSFLNNFFNYILKNEKIRNSTIMENFLLNNDIVNSGLLDYDNINYKNNKRLKYFINKNNLFNWNDEDNLIYEDYCKKNLLNKDIFLKEFIEKDGFINFKNDYRENYLLMKKLNILSKNISNTFNDLSKNILKLNLWITDLNKINIFSHIIKINQKDFKSSLNEFKKILNNFELNWVKQNSLIEKNITIKSYFFKKCFKDFKQIFSFQEYINEKIKLYKKNKNKLKEYSNLKDRVDKRIFNETLYFNNYFINSFSNNISKFYKKLKYLININF